MRHFIIPLSIILFLLTACHGEPADDPSEIPDETCFSINGDGGIFEFTIPVSNLRTIELMPAPADFVIYNSEHYTYYDAEGNDIGEFQPASEIHRIVYDDDVSRLEITKQGKKIIVKSICDASVEGTRFNLRLFYPDIVKTIKIDIRPGQSLKLVDIQVKTIKESEDGHQKVYFIDFNNDSDEEELMKIYPLRNDSASMRVDLSGNVWLKTVHIPTNMPVYHYPRWIYSEMENFVLGTELRYEPENSDTCVQVKIPPHTNGHLQMSTIFATATASYTYIFNNEILGRTLTAECKAYCSYPWTCSILMCPTEGPYMELEPIPLFSMRENPVSAV